MAIVNQLVEKYSNTSMAVRAAMWFTICNLILKGIALITVPIFTRVLPPQEYGLLSTYLSYEQLILVLSNWDVSAGAYQKGIFNYPDNLKMFTTTTQFFSNLMTVALFLLILLFRNTFMNFTGFTLLTLILLFLYMLEYVGYKNWLVLKQKRYDYKPAIAATLLFSIINVVVPLCAICILEQTADVRYTTGLIVSIIFFAPFYIKHLNYFRLFKNRESFLDQLKFIFKFQSPYVLYTISLIILTSSDRIMIEKLVGRTQAAYYSIAYSIAYILIIFQSSFDQVLVPWKYQKMEEKRYKDISRISTYMILFIGILILVYVLVAPEIMRLLFSRDYYEAVWSIPPIVTSIYFIYLGSVFVNIESYYEKTNYIMYVSIICSIINVVLNYMLIEKFGYIICGYTTLFSYMVFAIGHYYFTKRICKRTIPNTDIFNIKLMVIISIVVLFLVACFTSLYEKIAIRYYVLFGIILWGIMKRKEILLIYKEIRGQ